MARLRERTYGAALRQEVEFVERGEGDVLSRLSVDTSIVGERSIFAISNASPILIRLQCHPEPFGRSAVDCNVFCRP